MCSCPRLTCQNIFLMVWYPEGRVGNTPTFCVTIEVENLITQSKPEPDNREIFAPFLFSSGPVSGKNG